MFSIGQKVSVPDAGYTGTIIEERTNADGSKDYHIEYYVPKSRQGTYRTWWPASHLTPS